MEEHQHQCAFCDGADLAPIIDFGNVGLAGSFLRNDELATEKKYRLRLVFCRVCFAVQVLDKIPRSFFFDRYFYFSSSIQTLKLHFKNLATDLIQRFLPLKKGVVLEIGCNDGVLLKPIADLGVSTVIGVDPAKNVISTIDDQRITVVNDYFDEPLANNLRHRYGAADLILANNVFAHIEDIVAVTRALKLMLNHDGVFVFEVHYLGNIIDNNQYDMIYHEHIYYYSVLSLRSHFIRHGLRLFDLEHIQTHGGSIRVFVCKDTSRHLEYNSPELCQVIAKELNQGYDSELIFRGFSQRIGELRLQLMRLLKDLKSRGKVIAGYGASGRANTILQFCEIDNRLLDYMIDDGPAKHGFYTPGSHLEIKSSDILDSCQRPDVVVIFAWPFKTEIINKNSNFLETGGSFVVPLPEIEVIDRWGS